MYVFIIVCWLSFTKNMFNGPILTVVCASDIFLTLCPRLNKCLPPLLYVCWYSDICWVITILNGRGYEGKHALILALTDYKPVWESGEWQIILTHYQFKIFVLYCSSSNLFLICCTMALEFVTPDRPIKMKRSFDVAVVAFIYMGKK